MSWTTNLRFCLGLAFFVLIGKLQSQPEYAKELWSVYNQAPDFEKRKEAYTKLEKFYSLYHLDSALVISMQFKEEVLRKQPDFAPFVDVRIAATYTRLLEFEKSADILIPLLESAEKAGNDTLRAKVLHTLSNLNHAQKQKELALQRAREAALLFSKLNLWSDLCAAYNAIFIYYSAVNQDSAFHYLDKMQSIADKHDLNEVKATVANNRGVLYHINQDLEKALGFYEKAVFYEKKMDGRYGLCFNLVNIGYINRDLNRWDEAKKWFDEALPVCTSCGNVEGVGSSYKGLADVYEAQGDFKMAVASLKQLGEVENKLQKESYNRATQTLEAKYGSEKKERELLQQRATNYRQRVLLISLAAFLLVFALVVYLFWNRYRLKQKAELDAAIIREQQIGLNAVIEAQETERKRIAKDLHDGIAQELVALKLGLQAIQQKADGAEAGKLDPLLQQLDASCTEVRHIAHGMAPPMLEQQGLAPSLQLLLRNTLQPAGIHAEFESFELPDRLNEKMETGLYRIAQELLNNIVKHADAQNVKLQLYRTGKNLVMKMEDDGKGFDYESVKAKGSMGLLNILSRVRALDGTFFAEQAVPSGTVATVRIGL
ncbi:MAG: sensor histidine kinase [Saprospiraceae bacterium]|nr:sensor histidine kinase [Saprospiraceae bacterium]